MPPVSFEGREIVARHSSPTNDHRGMRKEPPPFVERLGAEASIARCRVVLSLAALGAVFIDPTEPLLARWVPVTSGRFTIDPYVLVGMATHLGFSLALLLNVRRRSILPARIAAATLWADIAFAAVIAILTEGATSPFYPFFSFAVVVAGLRSGLRRALLATAILAIAYVSLILVSAPGNANLYIMRPAYLVIAGYLVGYLGQECIDLHRELRQRDAAEQRHRIARDLHDGCVQALAGAHLGLEGCRRTLARGDAAGAMTELLDLRERVASEYDHVRAYMRALAGVEPSPAVSEGSSSTELTFDARVIAPIASLDHVLMIVREALSNIRRHAQAANGQVRVRTVGGRVCLEIVDDGVGMPADVAPWSIVSRVRELGGTVSVSGDSGHGARLSIELPG